MAKYLLDTNIIIYHLSGVQIASKFIDDNYNDIAISQITYIEVLSFKFKTPAEEQIIREFLNSFELLNINS